ncbi:MAG: anti-sigma factor family protein [Bacteroidota bacterium]
MKRNGFIQGLRRRFMITCQDVNVFLADYLEGALDDDLATRFEHHISGCAQCTAYLEKYRHTVGIVREAGRVSEEPPEPLVEETLEFLRHRLENGQ